MSNVLVLVLVFSFSNSSKIFIASSLDLAFSELTISFNVSI